MTTGSYVDDYDSHMPNGAPYGKYDSKVWGGNNRVPSEPWGRPHSYTVTVLDSRHHLFQYWLASWKNASTWEFRASNPDPYFGYFPINEAVNSLYGKLSQTDFNAGVFAGEFQKTTRMIAKRLNTLARAFRAVRKKRFAEALGLLGGGYGGGFGGSSASNWLALKYGWLPLLNDVSSGYKLLTQIVSEPIYVKGRAKRQDARIVTVAGHGAMWQQFADTRAQVVAEITSTLSFWDRVGLTDPATIAWELVPFSFVVDWALPIGNFLEACNAQSKLNGMFVLTKYQAQMNRLFKSSKSPGQFYYFPVIPPAYDRRVWMQRGAPLSRLPIALPTLQNPFTGDTDRVFSAFALIRQLGGR